MMLMMLNYLLLILSFFILASFHPIFMSILMLLLCLLISIVMSINTFSWLSFLLFYLMSGGILMLLLYMSCFSFNPIFKNNFILFSIIIMISFFVLKKHFFIEKSFFVHLMNPESGMNLGESNNMLYLTLISFFMFMCFFNISKIMTSAPFSMRKLYLSSSVSTANSYKYISYLLILK